MDRDPAQQVEKPSGASHLVADQGEVGTFLSEPTTYGPGIARVERVDVRPDGIEVRIRAEGFRSLIEELGGGQDIQKKDAA